MEESDVVAVETGLGYRWWVWSSMSETHPSASVRQEMKV